MLTKDVADLFVTAIGKIEFYWNFYVVALIALLGWIVSAKKPMPRQVKVLIAVGYSAFAIMNMFGLWGSYLVQPLYAGSSGNIG